MIYYLKVSLLPPFGNCIVLYFRTACFAPLPCDKFALVACSKISKCAAKIYFF
jgi:hypothetical protein